MTLSVSNRDDRRLEFAVRPIKVVTRGHAAGAVKRLIRPSYLAQMLKPFVLLDFIDAAAAEDPLAGWHPQSGIAVLTFLLEGNLVHQDTTGASRMLAPGGIEWMRAAGGAWHSNGALGHGRVRALQVGLAMPPRIEVAPAESSHVPAAQVPRVEGVRVLMGHYGGQWSPLASPGATTLLYVELRRGQKWTYMPTPGHTVAWAYTIDEALLANGETVSKSLAIFEDSDGPIEFIASADVAFVLGAAVRSAFPLVLGAHSVHTSRRTLQLGQAELARIGSRMGLATALAA